MTVFFQYIEYRELDIASRVRWSYRPCGLGETTMVLTSRWQDSWVCSWKMQDIRMHQVSLRLYKHDFFSD